MEQPAAITNLTTNLTNPARKAYFNDRAGQWLDMWYKDEE